MAKPYILCVDDESTVLDALTAQLKAHLGDRFIFEKAQSGEEALTLLGEILDVKGEVAVIISDQMMPGMKGHELLKAVNQQSPETVKILLTGVTNNEDLAKAVNEAKLYRYITKPWEKYDLQMTVEEATKTYMQRSEITHHTQLLELLVTAGQALAKEATAESLAQAILGYVVEGTGADRGGVMMFDNGQEHLHNLFFEKAEAGYTYTSDRELFPRQMVEAIGRCDESILVHTPNTNTLVTEAYMERYKPRSIYCRPLWHGENLVGLLYLESRSRKGGFTPNRIKFIELLSQHAALSIGRLRVIISLEQAVEARTREINNQKKIIENKNQDLLDSIHYARRLQTNFMPPSGYLQEMFSNSMLLYKPKSIVSGDFYWWRDTERYAHFAVVDCTGHGVPGGMLSILGLNLLNQLMIEEGLEHPDEVLLRMNRYFHQRLGRGSSNAEEANMIHYDSMDMALCTLHKASGKLEFSGAHRPIFIVRNQELLIVKGDNFSLGGNAIKQNARHIFRRETIDLKPGDQIYLFSDGLVDQFGGPSARKFTPKRLRDLILRNVDKPMQEIKSILDSTLEDWRGKLEQTDDILVLGITYDGKYTGWQNEWKPLPIPQAATGADPAVLRQAS